jgi:pyruvate,orthophosphate dikinase
VNGRTVKQGEWITIDGGSGRVFAGQANLVPPELSGNFTRLMLWADKMRHLRVRVNADTPADAHRGRDFGAEGIGLCRTEHMFFEGDRLIAMREMILAQDGEGRKKALAKLLPMQRGDFEAIFRAMEGYPVCIRLLDPPLHEFLPKEKHEIEGLAKALGRKPEDVAASVLALQETNPMLGLRGCRLGIIYPEISTMQARAIFEAACAVRVPQGPSDAEVMIPLTANVVEFRKQALIVRGGCRTGLPGEAAHRALSPRHHDRAAPRRTHRGRDRPRGAVLLLRHQRSHPDTWDSRATTPAASSPTTWSTTSWRTIPFQVLDIGGVGKLIQMACELGRKTRQDLKLGICGEHGGEPRSVAFFDALGMNYVSCSPYRVPIARLAAAQSSLAERGTMDTDEGDGVS